MVILLMQIRDCSTGHTVHFFTIIKKFWRMLMRTGLEAVEIQDDDQWRRQETENS